MRLLTANHGESRVFNGMTRQVEFTQDGRCYIFSGLRVGSELLVSNEVRLFHQIHYNGPQVYSQAFLHLARADVVAEHNELTLVPGDAHGDVMVWFVGATGMTSAARQVGDSNIFLLQPGQSVVTRNASYLLDWFWDGAEFRISREDRLTGVKSAPTYTKVRS
jgi:hypothetical protein